MWPKWTMTHTSVLGHLSDKAVMKKTTDKKGVIITTVSRLELLRTLSVLCSD
jgi:hypothetical protein